MGMTVVLMECLWTISGVFNADQAADELQKVYECYRRDCVDKPLDAESALKVFIGKYQYHALVIEAQYCLTRLYNSSPSNKYLDSIKEIVEQYKGDQRHALYLLLLMTYGQVSDDVTDRQKVFRDILDRTDEDIIMPSVVKIFPNKEAALKQIRQGAVWAELQERTRMIGEISKRVEIAHQVSRELEARKGGVSGNSLKEFVLFWIQTDVRRDTETQKIKAARNPSIRQGDPSADRKKPAEHPQFFKDPKDVVSNESLVGMGWDVRYFGYTLVFIGSLLLVIAILTKRFRHRV